MELAKKYKVIYADPPWRFEAWSHRGEGKGASQHYQCMNFEDLIRYPVNEMAEDDAALFLWVVQPMLPEAMELLTAWGFKFRTVAFIWVKMPASSTDDIQSGFGGISRIKPRLRSRLSHQERRRATLACYPRQGLQTGGAGH